MLNKVIVLNYIYQLSLDIKKFRLKFKFYHINYLEKIHFFYQIL